MLLASTFCEETQNAWKIVGTILLVVKIAVPILIIVTGIIPFISVVTGGKSDDLFLAAKKLFLKIVAGIIVVLIPTIIPAVIEWLSGVNENPDMNICATCMKSPKDCGNKDAYSDEEVDEKQESIGGNLDTGKMTDGTNSAKENDDDDDD